MFLCMYVCMFLSMYWVMSHQSDWGYYTALKRDPPMKWPVQTVLWFLKVNQGDIGFGLLENIASWKHLDNFSTLSGRNQFSTLCTFFLNCLFFPASVKLVPYMRRSFGKTTLWWCGLVMRLFYVTDFVYEFRFASFCHENEMIMIFKWTHNKSGMN